MCRPIASARSAVLTPRKPPPLCDWRSVLCLLTIPVVRQFRLILWFSIGLGTSMSPRNRLVTRNSRAVSVCVSPSFPQNLSATRAASRVRLLLLSSSNLFATGSAVRRSPCNFRSAFAGFEDRMTNGHLLPPFALDAHSQSLLGTPRQCRAVG